MRKAGIIALDLDGTLLNSNKELSRVNLQVLEKAAAKGFAIVPTTGRFYGGMPEFIRNLPFVRYAITINGAQVQDLAEDKIIYRAEIPWQEAVSIMEWLETFPGIYDCYMDNDAFMTGAQKLFIDEIIADDHYRRMVHELRKPVPELKAFIKARFRKTAGLQDGERVDASGGADDSDGKVPHHLTDQQDIGVQKVQLFTANPDIRLQIMEELPKRFADLAVSSSHPQNIEINQSHANKGEALMALASYLDIPNEKVFSFGDGLNDLTMIQRAGWGIAMANGCDEVKAAADAITASCDEDGVAKAIEKYCLGEEK